MRTCDVFGIQELHVIEELNVKRIDREIAMGAQKWVDLMRHNSTKQAIESIKKQGYQIVATTPHIHECSKDSPHECQHHVQVWDENWDGENDHDNDESNKEVLEPLAAAVFLVGVGPIILGSSTVCII